MQVLIVTKWTSPPNALWKMESLTSPNAPFFCSKLDPHLMLISFSEQLGYDITERWTFFYNSVVRISIYVFRLILGSNRPVHLRGAELKAEQSSIPIGPDSQSSWDSTLWGLKPENLRETKPQRDQTPKFQVLTTTPKGLYYWKTTTCMLDY